MIVTWIDTAGQIRDQIIVHPNKHARGDAVLAKREPKFDRERRALVEKTSADAKVDM